MIYITSKMFQAWSHPRILPRPDVNLFFSSRRAWKLSHCLKLSIRLFSDRGKQNQKNKTVNKNWGYQASLWKTKGWGGLWKYFTFFGDTTEAKLIYILWWRMGAVAKAFYFPWFLFSTRSLGVISYYIRSPSFQSRSFLRKHSDECCINSFIL